MTNDRYLRCADPEEGTGGPDVPHLKNHKNKGFLSNTGLDPLKITKLQSQHSMLGHHRHASKTPFKWRFPGGSMMARLQWYLFDLDPLSPLKNKTKKHCKSWTPLTKLSGSVHALRGLYLSSLCESLALRQGSSSQEDKHTHESQNKKLWKNSPPMLCRQ